MAKGPSEVLRDRVREVRERRGWSQEDLADRLAALGVPLGRVGVAKIETGRRGVSLDEALALAAALSVPPGALFLPAADHEPVAIAPHLVIEADRARRWLRGGEPLSANAEDVDAYEREQPRTRTVGSPLDALFPHSPRARRMAAALLGRTDELASLVAALKDVQAAGLVVEEDEDDEEDERGAR